MSRILICEREPAMRTCLARLFEGAGHHVREAEDGEAAIHAALADPPDLMTLCVALEKQDGYDVLARLAREEALARTRFLVVTGQSRPADREKALALGAHDFVLKPFGADQLLATANGLLGREG